MCVGRCAFGGCLAVSRLKLLLPTLTRTALRASAVGVPEHRQCCIPGAWWLVRGPALSKSRREACVLGGCVSPPKSSMAGELPTDFWGTQSQMLYPDFPGGPVVKTPRSHCRGHGVRSLVRVRSHMLHGAAKKKKKKPDKEMPYPRALCSGCCGACLDLVFRAGTSIL